MKYRDALKLHNEDEVIVKRTGKPYMVLSVNDYPEEKLAILTIVGMESNDYCTVNHREIR